MCISPEMSKNVLKAHSSAYLNKSGTRVDVPHADGYNLHLLASAGEPQWDYYLGLTVEERVNQAVQQSPLVPASDLL